MKILIVDIRPWNQDYLIAAIESCADGVIVPEGYEREVKKYGIINVIPENELRKRFTEAIVTPQNYKELERLMSTQKLIIRNDKLDVVSLENLVAKNGRFYVQVRTPEEAETAANILEVGVYGVVLKPRNSQDIRKVAERIKSNCGKIQLVEAKIAKIETGIVGYRVFVDTISQMRIGQGMLIGNTSDGYFLVHSECIENPYTGKRPFRVNGGGLHAYLLQPSDRTEYLSELKTGDPVLIVDASGRTQTTRIGRVKIEKRPLVLVEAIYRSKKISHYLQNASTVNLLSRGKPKPITELSIGDYVLVHVREAEGRHYGIRIKEDIMEK